MNPNRLTCTLFKKLLVLPPEALLHPASQRSDTIRLYVSKYDKGADKTILEYSVPPRTRRLEIPSEPFLEMGYRPGNPLQLSLSSDGIFVDPLELSVDTLFERAEIDATGVRIPPSFLIQAFTGVPNTDDYITGGYLAAKLYVQLFERLGRQYSSTRRVLDFGCGCGRVLTRMPSSGTTKYYGVDLYETAILWLRRAMPHAQVSIGSQVPPLSLDIDGLDLLYAISVLTHLDKEHEQLWLSEWSRRVKKGGCLLVTFRGEGWVDAYTSEDQNIEIRASWDRTGGFCFRQHDHWAGVFPDYYCGTYHSYEYVAKTWGDAFEIVDIVPQEKSPNRQDIAVMRKR